MTAIKLLSFIAIILLVPMAGCSSSPEVPAPMLAQRVYGATSMVSSYELSGTLTLAQQMEEGVEEGEVKVSSRFQSPNKLHVVFTSGQRDGGPFTGLPSEVLFDGEKIYLKNSESAPWQEGSSSIAFAALAAAPSLGQIASWALLLQDIEQPLSEDTVEEQMISIRGRLDLRSFDSPLGTARVGTLEIWAGESDNLIRRVEYKITQTNFPPNILPRVEPVELTLAADLVVHSYNQPVEIEAPIIQ